MKRTFLLLLTLIACWSLPAHAADKADWLVGKWELTYDPDGGEKDWMEFAADGKVVSISAKGRRVPGKYSLAGEEVRAMFEFQGKTIPMLLTTSPDRKKLLYYSQKSRHTAEYQKVK